MFRTKTGREIKFLGEGELKEVDELFGKLLTSGWSGETLAGGEFDENNPTAGQCTVTSMVVFDLFGGKIMRVKVGNGVHAFNEIDGRIFDLTQDQFTVKGIKLDYSQNFEVLKEDLLEEPGVRERYLKLEENLGV